MGRQLPNLVPGERWHCAPAGEITAKALQNSAWRAPGFKGKEAGGEGDHIEDETLWLLRKKGLPSLPRACNCPGRHEGQLSVLLCEQQGLTHPTHFGSYIQQLGCTKSAGKGQAVQSAH